MGEIAITMTIGCDLGDRKSDLCALDAEGNVVWRRRCATTRRGFRKHFEGFAPSRVVVETCTHSPWVSFLLKDLGHECIVANARRVQLISQNVNKRDAVDAELLARLGRADVKLLSPVEHRGPEAQANLAVIRSRANLVEARSKLINHARGIVKSFGERLPSSSGNAFSRKVRDLVPAELREALFPVLDVIHELTDQIKSIDKKLETKIAPRYPDVELLRQVNGVGLLTALTYILTLEHPERFKSSRRVGAFLGLRPASSQSGKHDPEMHITKGGDVYLRSILINCSHYILGPHGKDSDLRRWGLGLAARGKKNAKKRAVVAVARKLSVLLHRLWVTGEVYQPLGYIPANARLKMAA